MPYKFETLKIKLPKNKDRQIKITEENKQEIKYLYFKCGLFIREIARQFQKKCCRRSIQFILFPERITNSKRYRNWRDYYEKTKNTKSIKEHRRYKQKTLNKL